MSRFDKIINRKNTSSVKWEVQGGDYIPLWVADMDFQSPEPILNALIERGKHGIFGYTMPDEQLNQTIISYYKNNFNYDIEKEWLVWTPNVNVAANLSCRAVEGDIMFNTPIYSHINMKLARESRKNSLKVPLKIENNKYTFDFVGMEKEITKNIKIFILCNPHNPVGRAFTINELEQVAEFAKKHDLLVISDEIHSDLVFEGKHTPFFTLSEDAKNKSITLHSASKTYNLPGIPCAFAIIPNEDIRNKFVNEAFGVFPPMSAFAVSAYKSAFNECEPWRIELLEYIKGNHKYIEERVSKIKGLQMLHAESTYLAWIDAKETGIENPYQFFLDKAQIKFGDGSEFEDPTFIRVNLGCPKSTLEKAFDKVEEVLKER